MTAGNGVQKEKKEKDVQPTSVTLDEAMLLTGEIFRLPIQLAFNSIFPGSKNSWVKGTVAFWRGTNKQTNNIT